MVSGSAQQSSGGVAINTAADRFYPEVTSSIRFNEGGSQWLPHMIRDR